MKFVGQLKTLSMFFMAHPEKTNRLIAIIGLKICPCLNDGYYHYVNYAINIQSESVISTENYTL